MSKEVELCYKSFGVLVKTKREQLGISQLELARVLGWTRPSIANIEAGKQRVLLHSALILMSYLKIKPAEIVVLPRIEIKWDNV